MIVVPFSVSLCVAAEESAKSPNFKKAWESYSKFRADYSLWREYGYLNQ